MDAIRMSAEYAAFVWYSNKIGNDAKTVEEARLFARDNWVPFVAVADPGWGRLLMRLTRGRQKAARAEKANRLRPTMNGKHARAAHVPTLRTAKSLCSSSGSAGLVK
jgi:hypothetical protein